MKVLLIGSGAREHALAQKISQSPQLKKLYAAPGNSGISQLAECLEIKADNIQELLAFAKKESIDLTIVGPEAPLVAGIVDAFEAEGLKIFGPNQKAARLEGSKVFSKLKMEKYGIPTAPFDVFSHIDEAKRYVIEADLPIVIKADGLAQGKGVKICDTSQEAVTALTEMMSGESFGDAGKTVVIERKMEGEELSILALTDGEKIIPLATSQDHKRAYDNDRGPNTGGMGAYSPCPLVSDEKFREIIDLAIKPMVQGMAKEGIPYRGLLYAGIMLTKDAGPIVLEYNCRFGDPEAEVVLPRLKSDLLPVLYQIACGKLETETLEWHDQACIAIVMASGGYPGHYDTNFEIRGIESVSSQENIFIFHAGTVKGSGGEFRTSGGRVLAVSALGENLRAAHDRAYQFISKIHFNDCFYRRDIGRRALEVFR
ncbi:MAG: phosphoribosylamine--glycine ligase [Candidatus Omnitrophica bacterium]|nr:phosphoribosylamine--glycine ligase [Candidatus Omnitrophota bacterium]